MTCYKCKHTENEIILVNLRLKEKDKEIKFLREGIAEAIKTIDFYTNELNKRIE